MDGLLSARKRNAHVPLWNYAVLRGQVPDLRREGVFFTAIGIMAAHCQTSLCLASLNLLLLPLPFETQLFKQFFKHLFYFGNAGYSLLHTSLSLVVESRGYSSVLCLSFLVWWRL